VTVALAHDYLTQRGGAERVVLSMTRAFPGAPLYTSLFEPRGTFPEFSSVDVRPSALNAVAPLRRHHRWALPFLAPAVASIRIDADVVLCSSSGWAHGIRTAGRKLVYCHAPARWLYQTNRYVRDLGLPARVAAGALAAPLRRWDRGAAASANRYLVNSSHVAAMVKAAYGIDAQVLHPPPALQAGGVSEAIPNVEPGFFLCVSRLLPYKNVTAVVEAFASRPHDRLVVIGSGPDESRLRAMAPPNVRLVGTVGDERLRWAYAACAGVIAASYEDFGLIPLEAASFGKPAAVLRFGGYLDTVREGETGVFFDQPTAEHVAASVDELQARVWGGDILRTHAERYSEARFIEHLRALVADEGVA
jgi:glycosyltransferase involved in cell wall biosynthesis